MLHLDFDFFISFIVGSWICLLLEVSPVGSSWTLHTFVSVSLSCPAGIRILKLTNSPGKGLLAQGYDPTTNSYHNRFQPYISYWGAAWTMFFILVNGFSVFWHFNASGFFTACMSLNGLDDVLPSRWLELLSDVNIPIFLVLYFGYKFTMKTQFWKPEEMDFVTVSCSIFSFPITLDWHDVHTNSRVFLLSKRQRNPNFHRNTSEKRSPIFFSRCINVLYISWDNITSLISTRIPHIVISWYFLTPRISAHDILQEAHGVTFVVFEVLQFAELGLHPDAIHFQLPLPIDDQAPVHANLLRSEKWMGRTVGKRGKEICVDNWWGIDRRRCWGCYFLCWRRLTGVRWGWWWRWWSV